MTLIGDAAHPMLPFLAQGGAMAIEDAAVLAHCLEQETVDPARALRAYELQRRGRVARAQREARRNSRTYHLGGPLGWARNRVLAALGGETAAAPLRLDLWLAAGLMNNHCASSIPTVRWATRGLHATPRRCSLRVPNSAGTQRMFETTIAGSLPKPSWLAEPNKLWPQWQAAGDELAAAKADATLLALKEQEDAGIDIVTDGEMSRQHFVHGFLEFVDGIDFAHKVEMGIRADRYKAMVPQVVGELRLKGRVHATEATARARAYQAQAQDHHAGADDHHRHHRGPPLRRPREDGDGVRRSCSTRKRARSRPTAST